jgi:phosphopantetheinyl transferase
MTKSEYRKFMRRDDTGKLRFFYTCWVRKEATVKAWGRGIDDDLCKIRVIQDDLGLDDIIVYSGHGKERKAWRIQNIGLGDGYFGALTIEEDAVPGGTGNEV